jgi:hypothetical protein
MAGLAPATNQRFHNIRPPEAAGRQGPRVNSAGGDLCGRGQLTKYWAPAFADMTAVDGGGRPGTTR